MKHTLVAFTVLLIFLAARTAARAQWGWPPPGYNTATGIRCCDGSQYGGLRAVWRQRRQARRCNCTPNAAETSACSAAPPINQADAPSPLPERPGR
jgi:hypothetical protein